MRKGKNYCCWNSLKSNNFRNKNTEKKENVTWSKEIKSYNYYYCKDEYQKICQEQQKDKWEKIVVWPKKCAF